jgi:hypothetical protein
MTVASKIRIGPPKIINVHAPWASTYFQRVFNSMKKSKRVRIRIIRKSVQQAGYKNTPIKFAPSAVTQLPTKALIFNEQYPLWNSLPSDIVTSPTLDTLRRRLAKQSTARLSLTLE